MSKEIIEKLEVELDELKDKIFKLDEFINSKKYFELHYDMQHLLQTQYHSMRGYKDALEKRIAFLNEWVKPTEQNKIGNACSPSYY
jgi:hypothetical protein